MGQNNFASTQLLTPDGLTDAFRQAFRHHPAGVAILTAETPEGPIALTVSSLISVSASPPLVAFSLSAGSYTAGQLLKAETLVIHFPSRDDKELALICASPGRERFSRDIAWQRLPTGEPRYTNIETWFRARSMNYLQVEGATVVTARILDGEVAANRSSEAALIYLNRQWHRLEPENGPFDHVVANQAAGIGVWRFWTSR